VAVFLGFSAEIQGINYPAVAIFKLPHSAGMATTPQAAT
jgi:hypothetical protein